MAISRVPGFSLLANLDRQGTDLSLTSSGQTLQYWDVTNYRIGINNSAPQQALDVSGNIMTSNGHVLTNANLSYDIGSTTNWWRDVYANTVVSSTLTGTLLTNTQPNITSIGNLSVLNVTGNLSVNGNLSVDGNLIVNGISVGNLAANTITADIFGNITGYVLQGDQPFITNLANITVNTITILGGNLVIGGNVNFDYVNANVMFQGGNQVLDTATNIQISGDTVGYGNVANIHVELATTGVGAGVYGDDGIFPQISVDSKGRVTSAANISFSKVANLNFIGTTISSNTDITIATTINGNIYLNANGSGTVQFVGSDAIGLPSGDNSTRPLYPVVGYTRFNTDRQSIEYYDGTQWLAPGEAVISSQVVNPDGVANAFVLSSNTSTAGVLVSINGTLQQPITSYDIVGNNQIIFTETPLTTDIIEIRYISVGAVTVGSLTFGSTTAVSLDIANVNVTGNLLPSANVTYDLGSSTLRWRTGYFSANTIDIGGGTIGLHDTLGFTFTTPGSEPQYMMPNGASTSNTFTSSTVTIQGNLAVDGNITAVGNVSGQYILGSAQFLTGLPIGYSNVNAKAYTESMGFANYSNVNVAAYTTTQSYTNYSNVNVAAFVTTNGLSNYSNVNVVAYTQTQSFTNYSNVNLSAYLGGAVTIGGNLTVNGDLFINGNSTIINANNVSINDSMIYLADDNPADTLDIGIVSAFTSAVRYQHTGFVRDATDGTWKLFANVVPEPTTTVDFTDANYSNLLVGNLQTIGLVNVGGNLLATNITGTIVTANQPNITGVGNLTSGTWNANTIAPNRGGTGLTASGNSGNVLTSNGSTWVSQAPATPFSWNVTYITVTVAENGTYTLPANCIQVNGYVDSRLGFNTGSQAKIDIRNAANTILSTIYAGLTSVNDGGGGGNWFIPFSLPISSDANNIRMTKSSGGNTVTLYLTSYVTRS